MTKKIISCVLTCILMCNLIIPAFAYESDAPSLSSAESVYTRDITNLTESTERINGIETSIVSFWENGTPSEVKTERYADGRFIVTVTVDGETTVTETTVTNPSSTLSFSPSTSIASITYPHREPYWYAGSNDYSTKSVSFTVAVFAGVISAALTVNATIGLQIANAVYASLPDLAGWDTLYFTTKRYYSYYALSAQGPVTWYNKFVTYAYYDKNRLDAVSGFPVTEIYESAEPM